VARILPAAVPIQIFVFRDTVESRIKAKPKAAANAMMELLLRVRRRVVARKSAGNAQGAALRARWLASRVAMQKKKPIALGWRKSSLPRRKSSVAGRDQATMATRQEPQTKPFMIAAACSSTAPSRRMNQMPAMSAAHAHK